MTKTSSNDFVADRRRILDGFSRGAPRAGIIAQNLMHAFGFLGESRTWGWCGLASFQFN